MNIGLDSNNKSYNNCKYYIKYLENDKWKLINRSFCLNVIDNSKLYGQFITSNWFQIPVDIKNEYIFQLVSIENGSNSIKNECEFKITPDIFKECIVKINNINTVQEKITLYNNNNTFVLNFREHIQHNKNIYLISLPEFMIYLKN